MKTNKENLECTIKSKNYTWFDNNDYNLNIIAIRTTDKDNKVTNIFDDYITLTFKVNGIWKFFQWEATTSPGSSSMTKYSNPNGVAILATGQYIGSHEIRKHKNQYYAICQKYNKKLKVYRDSNKDLVYDYNKIYDDASGINIHSSGIDSVKVDGWSQGCLVFKRKKDFNEFMKICNISRDIYGNSFTITLIESADLK